MLTHLVHSNEITDSINGGWLLLGWVLGNSCLAMELGLPGGEEREGDHLGLCSINDSQGPKCVITGYCRTARPQATGSLLSTLKPQNTYTCNEISNLPCLSASWGLYNILM